jgi:hypothetical protein
MRLRLVLLLTLLLAPLSLQAQAEPLAVPRFSASMYTGARVPFVSGWVTAFGPDGRMVTQVREERGGAMVLGGDLELGTGGPLRLMIGALVSQTGRGDFYTGSIHEQPDLAVQYVGQSWFAKAGLSYRIMPTMSTGEGRRLAFTDLFVAPALVRELGGSHPALNFGFKGAFPVGERRRTEINVGLEDYLVFWRHDAAARRLGELFGEVAGAEDVELLYDTSNRFILRIGASVRR